MNNFDRDINKNRSRNGSLIFPFFSILLYYEFGTLLQVAAIEDLKR